MLGNTYSRFVRSVTPFKNRCGFLGYVFGCFKIPMAVKYRERYEVTIDEEV